MSYESERLDVLMDRAETNKKRRLHEVTQANFLTALTKCATWWEVEETYRRWLFQMPEHKNTFRRMADATLSRIELSS